MNTNTPERRSKSDDIGMDHDVAGIELPDRPTARRAYNVIDLARRFRGLRMNIYDCPDCGGSGEGPTDGGYSDIPLCQSCKGTGRKPRPRHVCGLQGYNPGYPHYDPECPACAASRPETYRGQGKQR